MRNNQFRNAGFFIANRGKLDDFFHFFPFNQSVVRARSRLSSILILSLLLPVSVLADDLLPESPGADTQALQRCGAVDLRPTLGPARNQGETALCFAYSTADLISQRVGFRVSTLDLATSHYFADTRALELNKDPRWRNWYEAHPEILGRIRWVREQVEIQSVNGEQVPYVHRLEGGEEDVTLALANTKGLCAEEALPGDGGFSVRDLALLESWVRERSVIAAELFQPLARGVAAAFEFWGKLSHPHANSINARWIRSVDQRCHERVATAPLIPVRAASALSLREYQQLIARGELDREKETATLMKALNYALDHERSPSIGYNGYTLEDKEVTTLDDGDHASLVAGRRLMGSQCQYLIRNTYGSDCQIYKEELRSRCEAGHIWLNESELTETLYSVIYLR